MTGTSSARPAALKAYRTALVNADNDLDDAADGLDRALRAFRDGAGIYAPGFDAAAPGGWIRDLAAESRHLRNWVASVGAAFEEADSGSDLVTADDSWLSKRVGEPTILEAEQAAEGQADAAELRDDLEALGIDPDDFDPEQLHDLDPGTDEYRELFETLEAIGDNMWSEDYAVGLFDQMGPDGIQATLAMIEMYAAHQQSLPYVGGAPGWGQPAPPDDLGSIQERLLDPFVHGWAIASGSVDLAEEREALLTVDDDINGDGRWQQHQLALLISDDGHHYDPDFLARAAEVILVSNADVNWPNLRDQWGSYPYDQTYPPLAIGSSLWDDPELAFNQLIAVRALADNDQASFAYAELGGPEGREERLDALISPNTWGIIEDPVHSGGDPIDWDQGQELAERFEQYAAEAVQGITIDAVADDPSLYDRSLDVYADVVRVVGDGDVPDVTKRVVASAFGIYVDDIGESALVQTESRLDTDAADGHDYNRPDLVNFFKEIGYDEEAAARLGQSTSLWVTQQSLPILGAEDADQAAEAAFLEPSLILGAMEDGFTATGDAMAEANAGFISGLQAGSTVLRVVGVAAIPRHRWGQPAAHRRQRGGHPVHQPRDLRGRGRPRRAADQRGTARVRRHRGAARDPRHALRRRERAAGSECRSVPAVAHRRAGR